MRILHTSDWHLGRAFHRVDMLAHQAAFVDHLVDVVRSEAVDVVVVAGDVYDRALPSVDTVALLDDALARVRGAGAQLLITSGNHDSAGRLGFASSVLERGGVHLRTRVADVDRPVLLDDVHGPVALYGLPYLEPTLVAGSLGAGQRNHEGVLTAAMDRVRADLARRPGGTRSLVAAHAFVVGGEVSDSERDISVGGVGSVPTAVFDGVDYAALGHLHGRQRLDDGVRYSGSPLAYSFSEARQRKGSWVLELGVDGLLSVEPVEAPVPRALMTVRGDLDDLLTSSRYSSAEDAWCQVTLTDGRRPRSAMERVRHRFPHALVLAFDPQGEQAPALSYSARSRGLDELDLCCGFVEHVRGGHAVDADERQLLRAALEGSRVEAAERDTVDGDTAAHNTAAHNTAERAAARGETGASAGHDGRLAAGGAA